jgi:hypothetical protein
MEVERTLLGLTRRPVSQVPDDIPLASTRAHHAISCLRRPVGDFGEASIGPFLLPMWSVALQPYCPSHVSYALHEDRSSIPYAMGE